MPSDSKKTYIRTPVLRVVRAYLHEPNEPTKMPNGKVYGDGSYQIDGYFDPSTDEGKAFLHACIAFVVDTAGFSKADAVALVRESFYLQPEAVTPVRGIPETWRFFRAKTKYGPVETIDTHGNPVPKTAVYPGIYARAAVTLRIAELPNTRPVKMLLRPWLASVLVVDRGERLFGGTPPAATTWADHINKAAVSLDSDEDLPF